MLHLTGGMISRIREKNVKNLHNRHTSKPLIKLYLNHFSREQQFFLFCITPSRVENSAPSKDKSRGIPRAQGLLKTAATHLATGRK